MKKKERKRGLTSEFPTLKHHDFFNFLKTRETHYNHIIRNSARALERGTTFQNWLSYTNFDPLPTFSYPPLCILFWRKVSQLFFVFYWVKLVVVFRYTNSTFCICR